MLFYTIMEEDVCIKQYLLILQKSKKKKKKQLISMILDEGSLPDEWIRLRSELFHQHEIMLR